MDYNVEYDDILKDKGNSFKAFNFHKEMPKAKL